MQDRNPRPGKKPQDTSTTQPGETRLESAGEVVVIHHKTPPKGPADKRIHPRRPLPLVPKAPPKPADESKRDA